MSDYIPEDIQLQMLKHLPVKSLLRFRCVCKSWKQLIDSHSFMQDHLALQKRGFIVPFERPSLLVLDPLAQLDASKAPLRHIEDFSFFGTLHGIVCLADVEDGIRLWNPSIRKSISIPRPQDHWYGPNDEQTTTYTSFWIDPSTKHFKMFMIVFGNEEEHGGHLYSSVQQDWKVFDLPEVCYHKPLEECPALVIGEVAYWRAQLPSDEETTEEYIGDGSIGYDVVVWSFDFEREKFDIMEAPSVITNDETHPMMCNWRENLSLLYLDEENRCDVYLKQGESWVNAFRLSLPSNICCVFWVFRETEERCRVLVQESFGVLATIRSELADTGGDDSVLAKSALDEKCTLVTNRMHCYGVMHYYDQFFVAFGYVESLLFP